MGTSKSVGEFVNKIAVAAPNAIQRADVAAVKGSAHIVDKQVAARQVVAAGGDTMLSGVGKAGARIGVRTKVETVGVEPSALVAATGPAHLVENRIRPHLIGPKGVSIAAESKGAVREQARAIGYNRTRRGKREKRSVRQSIAAVDLGVAGYGRKDVLNFGAPTAKGPYRRYAVSKGVPVNRRPWRNGVDAAKPLTGEAFRREHRRGLTSVFG